MKFVVEIDGQYARILEVLAGHQGQENLSRYLWRVFERALDDEIENHGLAETIALDTDPISRVVRFDG